jgi:formylglycine-generating enzyme required for sulfatase activity
VGDTGVASVEQPQTPANVIWIPGGTFRMGSDKHYPEEAPIHLVTVGGFWSDRTPVTNRQFRKFINETGYVTFADRQRLGVDGRLVVGKARSGCAQGVLHPGKSPRWSGRKLRPLPARDQNSPQGHQRRLALVRFELLPPQRPPARHAEAVDTSTSYIGFRCVVRTRSE